MNTLRTLLTGIVAIAFQFALAIVGWGGVGAFFAHPAMQALGWVTAAGLVTAIFTQCNMGTGEKEDRGNRWVLGAFTVIAILMAYFSAYTDRIGFWTIDGDTMRWVGVVVCFAGGVLRIVPVYVLKNRFSGLVAIQKGHTLETHGLYGVIRNPSYVGLLTTSIGWAMAFRSVVGILLALSLLIPLVARMHAEERMLREHFGAEYEAYFRRTWRLVPWVY